MVLHGPGDEGTLDQVGAEKHPSQSDNHGHKDTQ